MVRPVEIDADPARRELLEQVDDAELLDRLKHLSAGWYMAQMDGDTLLFNDMRFGQLGIEGQENNFVYSYVLAKKNGKWTATPREPNMERAGEMMKQLFERAKGR